MSQDNKSPMTLVSVARTTEAIDDKNRKKLALKLTAESAVALVNAITSLGEGKDIMIDIRTGKQTQASTGLQFPTSFIMVREHVAGKGNFAGQAGGNNYSKGSFKSVPKGNSAAAVSQAKRLAESE